MAQRYKPETPCELWHNFNGRGYPQIRHQGKTILYHRFLWEAKYGKIPPGMEIDHICGVRRCINLEHMQLLSGAEHRRLHMAEVTACPKGHSYTKENTYIGPNNGKRYCRECARMYQAKLRARRKP